MKKRSIIKKTIITLLPISLGLGVVLGITKNTTKEEVEGYNASSLPTTIDLNDASASNIRSYYSSLNNLSTSERQGTNLLKNLKEILKNDQKYYSYENGTSIWQMYEITDRDWDKSPASSTTYGTYNSSTNKITNYTYGTSASSSNNNPYIHALYINRNVDNQTTAWDDHNQDEWGINREHVWPKAEGFDSKGAGGARGDPMHLMAGNGYSNNIHSNYYYGYVKTSTSYTDCGSTYSNQSGNLRGTSKTLNSGTVFEPQDCDKGDIARAIFYMVARYNYLSGSDSDGINTNNPNLILTQDISDWSSTGYTSSTTTQGKLGVLTDLLAWHHADPVDEYEIHRNNLLYTNFTNNRNPFIDFPEWADFIWGSVNYNGSTYVSNDTTPTGYAAPASDTINGYNSGGTPTGTVTLSKNSATIGLNDATRVSATSSDGSTISWLSSNTSVATVSSATASSGSNIVVSGVAAGNAIITASATIGGSTIEQHFSVTVSGDYTRLTSISNIDESADYVLGTVENGFHYSGTSTCGLVAKPSEHAPYYYSLTKSDDTKFTAVSSINGSNYYLTVPSSGETFTMSTTSTKIKLGTTASDQNGDTAYAINNQYTSYGSRHLRLNIGTGIKTYSNSNTGTMVYFYKVTPAQQKTLSSISLDTTLVTKEFVVNDTFDCDGLVVTANYDDSTSAEVIPTSISEPDMSTAGNKTVTVSYTENGVTKSDTYTITVSEPIPEPTASVIIKDYAQENSWSNSVQYESVLVDSHITVTETGGSNSGKYYTSGYEWRFYQSESSKCTITVDAETNYVIDKIAFYYNVSNTGVLLDAGNNQVLSGEFHDINGSSASYKVGNTGSATNGQVKITKIEVYYHYVAAPLTSISATPNKTFKVGDVITSSDIIVTGNNGVGITDFTFADNNHQFTYQEAQSGGASTSKTFTNSISYQSLSCSLTVEVSRESYQTPSASVLEHTGREFQNGGINADSYSTGLSATVDGIEFYVDGYIYSNKLSLSQGKTSAPGQVYNTTPYSAAISSVSATGATPNIQYSVDKSTWVNEENANTVSTDYYYFRLYFANTTQKTYVNISQITVNLKADETPENLANFLMFEDTSNQCVDKFSPAQTRFENLSSSERSEFMTSDDYVISSARSRLEAWARHLGKEITTSAGDYVITEAQNKSLASINGNASDKSITIIVAIVVFQTLTLSALIIIKRKKSRI